MGELTVPADQLSATIPGLRAGREYVFGVSAVNEAGAGPAALSNPVTPLGSTVPSPWDVPEVPGAETFSIPHRVSYNGWELGEGTRWPIYDDAGLFQMMALRTQDAPLAGDGSVFGIDTEGPRRIELQVMTTFAELASRCGHPDLAGWQDPLLAPHCAMLRRIDGTDLPLRLDDFEVWARPRTFDPPGRRDSPRLLTVAWEVADPALYRYEQGEDAIDGWRTGTARVGVFEAARPYPVQYPGDEPAWGRQYRGPAGTLPGTWRYEGRSASGLLAVVNDGCRETPLLVRITGPVTGPMLINQTTFERLELDITILAGDWLDIDFRTGRVLLNGTANRYGAITRESTWWRCGGGTTLVRYLCAGEVTDSVAYAWWRSAW